MGLHWLIQDSGHTVNYKLEVLRSVKSPKASRSKLISIKSNRNWGYA